MASVSAGGNQRARRLTGPGARSARFRYDAAAFLDAPAYPACPANPSPNKRPTIMILDLTHSRTRLICEGPDAGRYLGGQVSQDLSLITPTHAMPACVCTAKGKLEAEIVIALWGENAFLIDAPADLAEAIALRLEKYLIADDCEIRGGPAVGAHLHIPGMAQMPPPLAEAAPPGTRMQTAWRLGRVGFDILLPEGADPASLPLADALGESHTAPSPLEAFEDERIRLGAPAWGAELDSSVLPPEALLDRTHISYNKGCYIGQETISRLRSVGRTTRLLCQVFSTGGGLKPGLPLFPLDSPPDSRPAGTLTSATADGTLALAFLRRPHDSPGTDLNCQSTESGEPISVEVRAIAPGSSVATT